MQLPDSAYKVTTLSKVLAMFLFVAFPMLGFYSGYKYKESITPDCQLLLKKPKCQPAETVQNNPNKIIGVLRTTGLMDEEKTDNQLKYSDYQIVVSKESYFLETAEDYEKLLGKCVEAQGEVKNLTAYGAKILDPSDVKEAKENLCSPYQTSTLSEDQQKYGEKVTLTGILEHFTRPAPDISYDYDLKLTVPFVDKYNASGLPSETDIVVVYPLDNKMWLEFEKNIGKVVTLNGYMNWGYAESRYLQTNTLSK